MAAYQAKGKILGVSLKVFIIAISIAVVSSVLAVMISPIEFVRFQRDRRRLNDLRQLNELINFIESNVPEAVKSEKGTIYVSLPDSDPGCSSWKDRGLPLLGGGFQYHCASAADYRNVDGSGWVPVDFRKAPDAFGQLPIDPSNGKTGTDPESGKPVLYFYQYLFGSHAVGAALEALRTKELVLEEFGTEINRRVSDLVEEREVMPQVTKALIGSNVFVGDPDGIEAAIRSQPEEVREETRKNIERLVQGAVVGFMPPGLTPQRKAAVQEEVQIQIPKKLGLPPVKVDIPTKHEIPPLPIKEPTETPTILPSSPLPQKLVELPPPPTIEGSTPAPSPPTTFTSFTPPPIFTPTPSPSVNKLLKVEAAASYDYLPPPDRGERYVGPATIYHSEIPILAVFQFSSEEPVSLNVRLFYQVNCEGPYKPVNGSQEISFYNDGRPKVFALTLNKGEIAVWEAPLAVHKTGTYKICFTVYANDQRLEGDGDTLIFQVDIPA